MGNCLLLLAPGRGIDRQETKTLQIRRGMPGGGGGVVTVGIEPYIRQKAFSKASSSSSEKAFLACLSTACGMTSSRSSSVTSHKRFVEFFILKERPKSAQARKVVALLGKHIYLV